MPLTPAASRTLVMRAVMGGALAVFLAAFLIRIQLWAIREYPAAAKRRRKGVDRASYAEYVFRPLGNITLPLAVIVLLIYAMVEVFGGESERLVARIVLGGAFLCWLTLLYILTLVWALRIRRG
jgi:hypothetical protein